MGKKEKHTLNPRSYIHTRGVKMGYDGKSFEAGWMHAFNELNGCKCKIIPFETDGKIVSTWMKLDNIMRYEVRYFLQGKICTDYFEESEIEILE